MHSPFYIYFHMFVLHLVMQRKMVGLFLNTSNLSYVQKNLLIKFPKIMPYILAVTQKSLDSRRLTKEWQTEKSNLVILRQTRQKHDR